MSRGKRTKVAKGIWEHQYGRSVIWRERGRQKEKHFGFDTPIETLKKFRNRKIRQAGEMKDATDDVLKTGGSFVRDVARYLRTRKGRGGYKSDRSHLRPWACRFRHRSRHAVSKEDVSTALAEWFADTVGPDGKTVKGKSPQELKHRKNVLRRMYRFHDGDDARTPCDGVRLPKIPRTRPKGVPDTVIATVADNLRHAPRLKDGKTLARFLVLATCGQRPCQVRRARRRVDVDFEARVWDVEPAKGDAGGPIGLNAEMLAAWELFDRVNAWGDFNARSFVNTLRRHGWPAGVRPYQMRHQVGQTLAARGVDLGDIQLHMGHTTPATTRRFYVPGELARAHAASARIDGRFDASLFAGPGPAVPARGASTALGRRAKEWEKRPKSRRAGSGASARAASQKVAQSAKTA
jgi:integrase